MQIHACMYSSSVCKVMVILNFDYNILSQMIFDHNKLNQMIFIKYIVHFEIYK